MLKRKIAKLEDVEEQYQDLYKKQSDGSYLLELEKEANSQDDPEDLSQSKKKINEFRQNNTKLAKEVQELKAQLSELLGDSTPEGIKKAKEAMVKMQQLEEEGLLKDGKIEDVVKLRTQTMQSDFEKQTKRLREENENLNKQSKTYKERLETLLIDSAAQSALGSVGVLRKGAIEDAMGRAKKAFKVNEAGEIEAQGEFDEKAEPLTIEKWAQRLLQEADYLFIPSQGGGAEGGQKGKGESSAKIIPAGDPVAFGNNLEGIASGKVQVAPAR